MEKHALIKKWIIAFEDGEASIQLAINKINSISENQIDAYSLQNYWRSESLDEFVSRLSIKQIENWHEINQEKAMFLITEMFSNITNDALFDRNATALEKKYQKVTGSISEWIFQDNITDSKKILDLLNKNTTIQL